MENQSKMRVLEEITRVEGEVLEDVKKRFEDLRAEIQDITREHGEPQWDHNDSADWDNVEVFGEKEGGDVAEMFEVRGSRFEVVEQQQPEQNGKEDSRNEYYRLKNEAGECNRIHSGEKEEKCSLMKHSQ